MIAYDLLERLRAGVIAQMQLEQRRLMKLSMISAMAYCLSGTPIGSLIATEHQIQMAADDSIPSVHGHCFGHFALWLAAVL